MFVVGNSRSGTTRMGRILGNHPSIFTFGELHFFEQLWSADNKEGILSENEAVKLASRLLCIQRKGYFCECSDKHYRDEAKEIYNLIEKENIISTDVYEIFLSYESLKSGKSIPCEQTPRNVFYIGEILELYPDARIINMVRDPRDVLLSQNRRLRRSSFSRGKVPMKQSVRYWVNYHPVTISKLWNAAISTADKYSENEMVHTLRFEDLVKEPESQIRNTCEFLGLSFDRAMLDIPQVGSSSEPDNPDKRGINKDRVSAWQKEGLNSAEIYLCQGLTKTYMRQYHYAAAQVTPNPLTLLFYAAAFPFKISAAFLLSLKRMKMVKEAIRRRLGMKKVGGQS